MNTPLLLTYARPMNYRAAGVPVPSSVAVRVEPGAPGALFYVTPMTAATPDVPDRVQLVLRPSDYTWAGDTAGPGTLWAVNSVGDTREVFDRVSVGDGAVMRVWGTDGRFHMPDELPKWVAPVAIVGGIALVAAIVVAARK